MVNIDAGIDAGILEARAWSLETQVGGFIAASMSFLSVVLDAPMAEAYALKEGLMLVQHIGCNRLIIQSDCMEDNGGFTANSAAALYDECNITMEHCNREANQAAHNLARRVMQSKQNCT